MDFTSEERRAIYCHELGYCFSTKQQLINKKDSSRVVDEEIDCDIFAVKKCDISPYVMEKALAKTYEYDMKHISKKKGITKERLDRYVNEMKARKRNIEKLIRD